MEYYNQLYFLDSRFFPPTKTLGVFFHWWVQLSLSPLGGEGVRIQISMMESLLELVDSRIWICGCLGWVNLGRERETQIPWDGPSWEWCLQGHLSTENPSGSSCIHGDHGVI